MFDKLYKTASGDRRRYGIYAPGLDRFILIDDNDIWMTLQTAELLSSKLPTSVFILNGTSQGIDNINCINYSILNKSNQRLLNVSITVAQQHPKILTLGAEDQIVLVGPPEDFSSDEKKAVLATLQEYAMYVHKLNYVITIQETFGNHFNNKSFANKYFPVEWYDNLHTAGDRTNTSVGVYEKIRYAIYTSSSIDDVNIMIKDIWNEHSAEQGQMIAKFYNLLEQPVPEELKDKIEWKFVTSSLCVI